MLACPSGLTGFALIQKRSARIIITMRNKTCSKRKGDGEELLAERKDSFENTERRWARFAPRAGKKSAQEAKHRKQSVKETTDSKCEELWFISVACLFPMFVLAFFWYPFCSHIFLRVHLQRVSVRFISHRLIVFWPARFQKKKVLGNR